MEQLFRYEYNMLIIETFGITARTNFANSNTKLLCAISLSVEKYDCLLREQTVVQIEGKGEYQREVRGTMQYAMS